MLPDVLGVCIGAGVVTEMRIIRGTYKEELHKLCKENMLLEEQLQLQCSTDAYKDDLINTLKSLLFWKDETSDRLRGEINRLRGAELKND